MTTLRCARWFSSSARAYSAQSINQLNLAYWYSFTVEGTTSVPLKVFGNRVIYGGPCIFVGKDQSYGLSLYFIEKL